MSEEKIQSQEESSASLRIPRTCASCGFLALFSRETQAMVIAGQHFRERGFHHPATHGIAANPVCALFLADLPAESDAVRDQLSKERPECSKGEADHWVQRRPGLTLSEHREMLDREFMLKRADALDEAMHERQDALNAAMVKREDERDCRQEGQHKQLMRQASRIHLRELLILGGAVIVIGFLGALVESGLWTPSFFDRQPNQIISLTPTPIPPTVTPIPPSPTPDTGEGSPQATP